MCEFKYSSLAKTLSARPDQIGIFKIAKLLNIDAMICEIQDFILAEYIMTGAINHNNILDSLANNKKD